MIHDDTFATSSHQGGLIDFHLGTPVKEAQSAISIDGKTDNFDLVRLVCAISVLFSHQFALAGFKEPNLVIHSLGGMAVLVFFTLSGFLVAASWERDPRLLPFAARRLLRLWPGMAMVILLSTFFLGPFVSDLSLREYFKHPFVLLYLQNLYFHPFGALPMEFRGSALPSAVNGSLWTIPLEVMCYVLLGTIGVCGALKRRVALSVAVLLAVALYCGWQVRGERWVAALSLRTELLYLIEFGLFFLGGVVLQMWWKDLCRVGLRWPIVAGLAAFAIAWYFGRPVLAVWCSLPIVTLALAHARTKFASQLKRIGDLSYGTYLYAFPIQQLVMWEMDGRGTWLLGLMISLVVTLTLAWLSWNAVEKPFLRLKPRGNQSLPVAVTSQSICEVGVGVRESVRRGTV